MNEATHGIEIHTMDVDIQKFNKGGILEVTRKTGKGKLELSVCEPLDLLRLWGHYRERF